MNIVKLLPAVKTPVWGGHKISAWGKKGCSGKIGETWELSFLSEGPSRIDGGEYDTEELKKVADKEDIGKAAAKFGKFPVLVKFIDAAADLSVQVHPDDGYALKEGLGYGKTEMWYVMDAEAGAGIYLGFNRNVTKEEVYDMAKNGTITDALNFIPVKKGDSFFVKAGVVHAIGANVTVAEIQQSSDLTYRVFDYNRLGADGKPRQLHLNEALKVMDFSAFMPDKTVMTQGSLQCEDCDFKPLKIAECNYFSVYKCRGKGKFVSPISFVAVICTFGNGEICGKEIKKGETFFVPAGKKFVMSGGAEYLLAGVGI